jgi:hypothetical protein
MHVQFSNIQGLRENAEKTRQIMLNRKTLFDSRRKGLKQQVAPT